MRLWLLLLVPWLLPQVLRLLPWLSRLLLRLLRLLLRSLILMLWLAQRLHLSRLASACMRRQMAIEGILPRRLLP